MNNYLVVALGNPGEKYEQTRHNAGWILADLAFPDLEWKTNKYVNALVADIDLNGLYNLPHIYAAKPLTFMNESGTAVATFIKSGVFTPESIIVIYDDIDLPIGKMKISFDRGSGGHNGIKSIETHLGSREFIRIRIGISKLLNPPAGGGELIKPNVLGNFEASELEILKTLAPKIKLAIETIIVQGKEMAMTEFNSQDPHIRILVK
jgi:PTH1 family peptidyl-tRNA hydrolase